MHPAQKLSGCKLFRKYYAGHAGGDHPYEQILYGSRLHKIYRYFPYQLPASETDSGGKIPAGIHDLFDRRDFSHAGLFLPILLFTDFQKGNRQDADSASECVPPGILIRRYGAFRQTTRHMRRYFSGNTPRRIRKSSNPVPRRYSPRRRRLFFPNAPSCRNSGRREM